MTVGRSSGLSACISRLKPPVILIYAQDCRARSKVERAWNPSLPCSLLTCDPQSFSRKFALGAEFNSAERMNERLTASVGMLTKCHIFPGRV